MWKNNLIYVALCLWCCLFSQSMALYPTALWGTVWQCDSDTPIGWSLFHSTREKQVWGRRELLPHTHSWLLLSALQQVDRLTLSGAQRSPPGTLNALKMCPHSHLRIHDSPKSTRMTCWVGKDNFFFFYLFVLYLFIPLNANWKEAGMTHSVRDFSVLSRPCSLVVFLSAVHLLVALYYVLYSPETLSFLPYFKEAFSKTGLPTNRSRNDGMFVTSAQSKEPSPDETTSLPSAAPQSCPETPPRLGESSEGNSKSKSK